MDKRMPKLGDKVGDMVTGFEGIVTGHAEYITGCDTYLVQPRCKAGEAGERPEPQWFDEMRLSVVAVGAVKIEVPKEEPPGADLEAPTK